MRGLRNAAKLKALRLTSLAVNDFIPPSPAGVAPATFILVAELKERVALVAHDRAKFRRTRGEETERALLKAFPSLNDDDWNF